MISKNYSKRNKIDNHHQGDLTMKKTHKELIHDAEALSLQKIEDAVVLYEAKGEEALDDIENSLTVKEYERFVDEVEALEEELLDEEDEYENEQKETLNEMAHGNIKFKQNQLCHIPYMALERFSAHTSSFGGALHCKIEKGHEFFYRVTLQDVAGNDLVHFNDSEHLIRGKETSDNRYDVFVKLYRKSHLPLRAFAENENSTPKYLFKLSEVDCTGTEYERPLLVIDTNKRRR